MVFVSFKGLPFFLSFFSSSRFFFEGGWGGWAAVFCFWAARCTLLGRGLCRFECNTLGMPLLVSMMRCDAMRCDVYMCVCGGERGGPLVALGPATCACMYEGLGIGNAW